MSQFITVTSFLLIQDAYMAKSLLESEGINVFLKDELSTQVNPHYSNTFDGVKLQVIDSEAERALQLLIDAGYVKSSNFDNSSSAINIFTQKLPLINKLPLDMQLPAFITFILLVILIPTLLIVGI
ncbi:MAG: DUF2007 domain-containing protein [Bacteroidales bacterium]|nr:DUF2007 domain-containing protein [Bacteroidales bacterium]